MVRYEVFVKGFLLGFFSCSILLFCFNLNIRCKHGLLESSAPIVPADDYDDYIETRAHMTRNARSLRIQPKAGSSSQVQRINRKGPRILCWVMTTKSSLLTKAVHLHNTWGKRCDKILFFISSGQAAQTMGAKEKKKTSDYSDYREHEYENRPEQKNGRKETDTPSSYGNLPVVNLENVPEGRYHLTAKTMHAFSYIHRHYLDEYDWFLKADDDTYVIMENLRHFLSHQDKNVPVYFGHHFVRLYIANGYNSGGSGYVMSQAALQRFGVRNSNTRKCLSDGEDEDVDIGRCMQYLGVGIGNTADQTGAIRFVCFSMEEHFLTGLPKWTKTTDAYGARKGIDSISRDVISFHYVKPWMMYALDYFVYRFKLRSEDEIIGK